jgi:iduronate 2-sulfatase
MNLMRTRFFLFFIAFTALSCAQEKPNEKLNVLLIIADDMRTELNCYGADYIHSPNIDKLAKNGVLFNNAYVQQAVCSASRASFLSGVRPNTTGVDYPYSNYFMNEFRPNHPMLAEHFEQNGYYAHTFGKIHHGPPDSLKTKHYMPKKGLNAGSHYALPENIKKGGKNGRGRETPPYECADVPDEAYVDGLTAREAVKVISQQKDSDKPFFLAVGFKKPHLPFVAPKKYWDLYEQSEMPLAPNQYHPENSPSYSTAHTSLTHYAGLNYYNSPNNVLPNDNQRKLIHAYAACISFIDAQVGKLIESLKETGKYDNTIIVFISDHGWHLGHQGNWGKTTNFENATRAPLIVSSPNHKKGKRSSKLVEYVDLYASLCDLTEIDIPEYTEGTSIKPLLENPDRKWKTAAFSQFPRGRNLEGYSMRTADYRYTEWRLSQGKIDSVELYDHKNDAIESINIAYKKENESLVKALSQKLNAGWKAALPEGVENNSNNPIAPPHVNWSDKKITVNRKKTITFKSSEVTELWKLTEGYQLSVKNQLLYIDVEHDANYFRKIQVSNLNVKATKNSVLKLKYKTIDNQPLTLQYHISSRDNWGELSSISLPSTNGEIQEITIPLASDVSMWEDKFEKMKVITEIIFCINAKEKFKGTLVLESLTIE